MADISVQVSSVGLTAYGAGAWGSLSFGGDTVTNVSIGSVDAFNSEGWGRLTWGSLVWGEDTESAIVSVTTPGTPTTWGQSTYGNYSWNQITGTQFEIGEESIFNEQNAEANVSTNILNISSASLVGTISGTTWGFQTWGSNAFAQTDNFITANSNLTLNTNLLNIEEGFAQENVNANTIVEVSTPGSNTTWGSNFWGSGGWNQIVGTLVQQGEETITEEQNAQVFVSTNIVNISAASLAGTISGTTWGFQTWGSNAFAQTDNFITANSNLTLNTNLLNIEEGFAQENVDTNTIVEVTSPGNLPWGATSWSNGSWGNIGGMEVSQGAEEEATPSIEVFVSTNLLTLTLTSIAQITADANITANTNLLTTSLGNEDAVPNTIVSVSTNLLNASVGAASGEVLSTVNPTGVNMTTSTGRVFIAAWAVVDIGVTNNWSVVDIAA